jgi:co-chaperonin GroES (HSP10)
MKSSGKKLRLRPLTDIILARIPRISENDLKTKGGIIMTTNDDPNFVNKYARSQCVAELVMMGVDAIKLFSAEDAEHLVVGTKIQISPFSYKIIDNDDDGMKVLLQKILGVSSLFEGEDRYHYILLQGKDILGVWEEIN